MSNIDENTDNTTKEYSPGAVKAFCSKHLTDVIAEVTADNDPEILDDFEPSTEAICEAVIEGVDEHVTGDMDALQEDNRAATEHAIEVLWDAEHAEP